MQINISNRKLKIAAMMSALLAAFWFTETHWPIKFAGEQLSQIPDEWNLHTATVSSLVDGYKAWSSGGPVSYKGRNSAIGRVYTVKKGDNLFKIAQNHNVHLWELLQVNEGLTEKSTIRPGDKISIPRIENCCYS